MEEIFVECADSLTNNVKVARVDNFKMFVEWNLILARFNERFCPQQALVNVNVERALR